MGWFYPSVVDTNGLFKTMWLKRRYLLIAKWNHPLKHLESRRNNYSNGILPGNGQNATRTATCIFSIGQSKKKRTNSSPRQNLTTFRDCDQIVPNGQLSNVSSILTELSLVNCSLLKQLDNL